MDNTISSLLEDAMSKSFYIGCIAVFNALELEAYLRADKLKELLSCQTSQSQNLDAE